MSFMPYGSVAHPMMGGFGGMGYGSVAAPVGVGMPMTDGAFVGRMPPTASPIIGQVPVAPVPVPVPMYGSAGMTGGAYSGYGMYGRSPYYHSYNWNQRYNLSGGTHYDAEDRNNYNDRDDRRVRPFMRRQDYRDERRYWLR